MNAIIRVAREQLSALGIPGSMRPNEIVEVISWFIKTEAYKFGGLDVPVSLTYVSIIS